jgi:hypothetical protein
MELYSFVVLVILYMFPIVTGDVKKLGPSGGNGSKFFPRSTPRVRWAAINAIGQLSTDLGPDLQVQYHGQVLPALAAAMDDFQNPRVQVSCRVGILCFFELEFPLVSYSVML